MDSLEDGAIVVVAGGRLKYMSGNILCVLLPSVLFGGSLTAKVHTSSYKFRQSTNFWYLTGWEEPESVLVLGGHPFVDVTVFADLHGST